MSRCVLSLSGCWIAFCFLSVQASGQTSVEAAAGTAASSTGAAGAGGGIGKSIGGVFRSLNETLKSTSGAGSSRPDSSGTSRPAKPAARHQPAGKTAAARRQSPPPAPEPVPSYEDARQIQKGIGREELLRRFGPPAMQIASANDAQTLSYFSGGAVVQLELQGGTVVSVAK